MDKKKKKKTWRKIKIEILSCFLLSEIVCTHFYLKKIIVVHTSKILGQFFLSRSCFLFMRFLMDTIKESDNHNDMPNDNDKQYD